MIEKMSAPITRPMVHPFQTDDPHLRPVCDKVISGTPLDLAEITALYASKDILAIGWLANYVREEKIGPATRFFVHEVANENVDEVVVSGDDLDRLCHRIEEQKKTSPQTRVFAYSVEQAAANPLGAEKISRQLLSAGNDGFLGSGVELFVPDIRQKLWHAASTYGQRAHAREAAVAAGLQVPLYLIQRNLSPAEQAAELLTFRSLPNTSSFAAISYVADTTTSPFLPATTGMQEMKHIAIARLALANVAHLRAYWQMLGGKLLQIALRFGASELDGTSLDGAGNREARSKEVAREIEVAGREPQPQTVVRKLIITNTRA